MSLFVCILLYPHPLPLACFPTSPEINAPWGSWAQKTHLWAFRIVSVGGEGSGDVVGGGTGSLSWAGVTPGFVSDPSWLSGCGKGSGSSVHCLDTGLWVDRGNSVSPVLPTNPWSLSLYPPHLLFLLPSIWQALI